MSERGQELLPSGDPPEFVPRRFFCGGTRVDAKDKSFVELRPFLDDGALGADLRFPTTKETARLCAGQVYLIETRTSADGGTTIRTSTAKWQEEFSNTEVVCAAQAASKASELYLREKARERRLGNAGSALDPCLAPLRIAYARTPPAQRAAFEVWVLNQLRRRP